jgi:V/A-type H+-transporting ATPase subunit A
MPGEEGYPAYLPARMAEFYERAGRVKVLGSEDREGTLTAIGAVSPPGGDLSDPVVQATLKVVKVFWGLDDKLAYRRHFPAINWLNSYSLYVDNLRAYCEEHISPEWLDIRQRAMTILQKESELQEIARLVGKDSLSPGDQIVLETAKMIREDFLHQNAFLPEDQYTSLQKQFLILQAILGLHEADVKALERGVPLDRILSLPGRGRVAQLKVVPEDRHGDIEQIRKAIVRGLEELQPAE